jgi:hypothetical protein
MSLTLEPLVIIIYFIIILQLATHKTVIAE